MKKNIFSSLVIILLLVGAGCKSRKEAVINKPGETTTATGSKKSKLAAIAASQANFKTISIRSKADLDLGGNSNNVSMNIRIKKDQVIWVSITAIAGLEVARAMITPDSIKIINRLQGEYTSKPFSYIYEFTNDQVDFKTVQSILVGNTMPEFINGDTEITTQASQTVLSSLLENLRYSAQLNERNKVLQTSLTDDSAGQALQVNYADFVPVSAREIPHSVNIQSAAERKDIRINLKYTRVTIDEALEFHFNVPKRVTIKE